VKKKKVCVAGGGPAGMTAALAANHRGHDVVLFEKSDHWGGQLRLAKEPPGKEKISWFMDYLIHQIEQKDIPVHLGKPATTETLLQENPDMVIIATGAVPSMPNIPGVELPFVFTSWDVLEKNKEITEKIVLVGGGGTVGAETALYLAPKNKRVFIIEALEGLALDMEPINRMDLLSKIEASKIDVMLRRRIDRIEQDGVYLFNQETGEEDRIKADAVVLSLGAAPVNELAGDIEGKVEKVFLVGDCARPRKIIDAVHEGFRAGIGV
jgi:NADPH-dependent 2,4-dienoyl-CoA reductase/sulfur reductase-like enzyme